MLVAASINPTSYSPSHPSLFHLHSSLSRPTFIDSRYFPSLLIYYYSYLRLTLLVQASAYRGPRGLGFLVVHVALPSVPFYY